MKTVEEIIVCDFCKKVLSHTKNNQSIVSKLSFYKVVLGMDIYEFVCCECINELKNKITGIIERKN